MAVFVALVSIFAMAVSANYELDVLAGLFSFVFVGTIAFVLIYLPYSAKHVACPKCDKGCTSDIAANTGERLAICRHCGIEWSLGIGSRVNGNSFD